MVGRRFLQAACALLFLLPACSRDRLQSSPGGVTLLDPRIDFGRVYTGDVVRRMVRLKNEGRAVQEVKVGREGATVFQPDPLVLSLGAGEVREVAVELTVRAPGTLAGAMVMLATDGPPLRVELTADARRNPGCVMPDPCTDAALDRETGTCTYTPRAEGAGCSSPDKCLAGTTCAAGVCQGTALDCDDQSVCTTDSCDPASGCVHVSLASTCVPSAPCRVAFCDPVSGCGEGFAADSTSCGPRDCLTKNVCRGGACNLEAVVDGESCGQRDSCHDFGVCRSGVCEQPLFGAIRRRFTYSSPMAGQGAAAIVRPPVVDAAGNLFFAERGPAGVFLHSLDARGAERWQSEVLEPAGAGVSGSHLLWQGRLVHVSGECAVSVVSPVTGAVELRESLKAANETLRCTALSLGPRGRLAVAGETCAAGGGCHAFIGRLQPDLTFDHAPVGAEAAAGVRVGPLLFDGGLRLLALLQGGGLPPQLMGVDEALQPVWSAAWPDRSVALSTDRRLLFEDGQGLVLETSGGKRVGTLFAAAAPVLSDPAPGALLSGGRPFLMRWECPPGGCGGGMELSLVAFNAGFARLWARAVAAVPAASGSLPHVAVAMDQGDAVFVSAGDEFRAFEAATGALLFGCPVAGGGAGPRALAVGEEAVLLTTRDEVIGIEVGWARPAQQGWSRSAGSNAGDGAPLVP